MRKNYILISDLSADLPGEALAKPEVKNEGRPVCRKFIEGRNFSESNFL
jgi:hypothetical protein